MIGVVKNRLVGMALKDIKTFQLFIGEATVTFGYIQSLSFALKRAVNKVLYCILLLYDTCDICMVPT